MRNLGVILLLVGVSEFAFRILKLNLEHVVFKLFGEYRTAAAVAFIVVGVVLALLGGKKKDKK